VGAIPSGSPIIFQGGALQYTASNTLDYSSSIVNSTGPIAIDTNGQNVVFASVLASSNTGGLTKEGVGTLALDASNAYTGTTTILGGVLQLGVQLGFPKNAVVNLTAGTLDVNGFNKTLSESSSFAAGGTLLNSGSVASTITISSSNTSMTIASHIVDGRSPLGFSLSSLGGNSGQEFSFTNSGNTFSGGVVINNAAARMYGTNANTAMGTGTITVTNSGFLMLWTNTGSYAGSTTYANNFVLSTLGGSQGAASTIGGVQGEKTAIFTDGNLAGASNSILTGTITLAANAGIGGYPGDTLTVQGQITGSGALNKDFANDSDGGNVTILTNTSNNYQGGTVINSGTLGITADAVLGTGNVTFGGYSTLEAANSGVVLNPNRQITISTAYAQISTQNNMTIAGNIGGTGALFVNGSTGILTLSGSNNYGGTLSASNSYAGTYIYGGELSLASSAAIPIGGGISFTGGALQYTASNTTDYSPNIVYSYSPIAIDTNGQNISFSSSLSSTNTGGLTKIGSGELTLNAANGYTGTTTINGGRLVLGNSAALPAGQTITFAGGGLKYTASNNMDYSSVIQNSTGPIAINTNGQNINFGTALSTSNSGGLTKYGSGMLTLNGYNGYSGATSVQGGTLQLQLSTTTLSPVSTQSFTSDATSGIGASPGQYTEALAFNKSALTINGVNFASANNTSGVGNLGSSWSFANPIANSYTSTNFISGFLPSSSQQTYNLLDQFYYEGTANNGAVQLTLTGLTPGQEYDARLYYRAFGSDTDNRTADFTFGSVSNPSQQTADFNEDANATGNYIDFQYTAGTDGTAVISEVNDANIAAGGSWHWYAFSNQVIPSSLPSTTTLSVAAGATLDLNGVSQTVASLTGSGTITNNNFSTLSTLTTGGDNSSHTFSGSIQDGNGQVALTYIGTGSLTLAGTNTYSGPTTLNAGSFIAGAANVLSPNSAITVNSAVLDVTAGSQTVNGLTVSSAGTLNLSGPFQK
jgi:autotransporter-associated beta strand protein